MSAVASSRTAPAARSSGDAAAASTAGFKRSFPGAADEADGRRVQPRHSHDGANPPAAASASSPSSGGATEAEGPSPATGLYRHALESIFAFLGRGELVTTLQVSRSWLAAVKSMANMKWGHPNPSSSPLCVIAESVMARHMASLGALHTPVQLSADSLWVLTRHMAHLLDLSCKLSLPSPMVWPGPLLFPAALVSLDIEIKAPISAAQVNAAIAGIGRLPHLECFTIMLPAVDAQISFALAALPQLRDLDLYWPSDGQLSDAQIDELRAMPQLRELSLPSFIMTSPLLQRLLRQPHALQWQEINPLPDLDDEAAECLTSVPSLTRLVCWTRYTRFDWLQRLPNLTAVTIGQAPESEQMEAAEIQSLLHGLQHCSNLQGLTLTNFRRLTAAHLATLLPQLPQLHTLELKKLQIDSLTFLAQLPTAQRLTHFELLHCKRLPLVQLLQLHKLRSLVSLTVVDSFDERMDSVSRAMLTPPSASLPQLKTFIYVEP